MHKKLNVIPVTLALLAISLTGLLAGRTMAQRDQPYRMSDRDLERIIRAIEKQADSFRKSLDDALDKSRFDGQRREDEINAFVREFDRETKRLHEHFDDHKSTSADVQSVLDRSVHIERFMRRNRLTTRAQNDWSALRAGLDQLATAYNVSWRWDGYTPVPTADLPYRISDREVERIIRNIESGSDHFRSSLDQALDRSRLNNTQREDDINAYVKGFYEETKRLHDHFDGHKSTSADVQSVLDRAARIEQFMRRHPLTRQAQNDWSALKVNLDLLARTYNVTWGWDVGSGSDYVPPRSIPLDLPLPVIINMRGATERRGRRISLARDGRAEVSVGNSLTTRYVDRDLAERLFADLLAARPLSQLAVDGGCARNSSLDRSIYITLGSERTPELSCLVGPRAEVLRQDVGAITSMLNVR